MDTSKLAESGIRESARWVMIPWLRRQSSRLLASCRGDLEGQNDKAGAEGDGRLACFDPAPEQVSRAPELGSAQVVLPTSPCLS